MCERKDRMDIGVDCPIRKEKCQGCVAPVLINRSLAKRVKLG